MRLIPPTVPLAGALALFATLAGCTQESTPGGPGVANAPKAATTTAQRTVDSKGNVREEAKVTTTPNVVDKSNTFTLHAPKMETTLDTGKKQDVDISISRGSEFKQSVKIEFKAPSGVTVTPTMATIPAGHDKVTVTLEATKDAPAGKAQVEVMAVPESGKSVSLEIPVDVKRG